MIIHQQHNSLGNHNYNAFFYDNCEWFYHFHKNYELAYVLDGHVELTLSENKYILPADTFALILPNEFHAYHTPEHSRVWIGVFSADFVGEFAKMTAHKKTDKPMFTCQPKIIEYLLHYLITTEKQSALLLKSALYAVCGEFLRCSTLQDASTEKSFIYDMIHYISANFQKEISLKMIAEAYGYEYHYLSRQFHEHFHMNFKQFLNVYRIDFACDQLIHTEKNITEIALNSGFQTMRTFNRAFLDQTGITPSEFRRSKRIGQIVDYPEKPIL